MTEPYVFTDPILDSPLPWVLSFLFLAGYLYYCWSLATHKPGNDCTCAECERD